MDALRGGCGVAHAQPVTFLVLYQRFAVMVGGDWAVTVHDLVTKQLLDQSLYLQQKLDAVPDGVPVLHPDDAAGMGELARRHHPFLVDGRLGGWKCWGWTLEKFLEAPYRDCEVHVSLGRRKRDDKTEAMPLGHYIESFDALTAAAAARGTAPPYLRAWHFLKDPAAAGLAEEYEAPAFAKDFFEKMKDPADRPPFQWLFVGPEGVRTPLHIDPALTHAWMAQIEGHKRWKFVPPADVHHLLDGEGFADLSRVDTARFPNAAQARVLETEVHPGQLVFIPAGWAHDVTSLAHSVALTHNYIDAEAFKAVVRQVMLRHCLAPAPPAVPAG
eukprot:TRINITY_DN25481_c0_g1_i1.p1 TRINITY_DN25481_c0_g1~~TRINITY_DN25481_c0_g1_i1.p1  ORF type:complete len:329 (+),score=100.23 TRINITY_DN25481_c0_g1_i1:42-1028(+)